MDTNFFSLDPSGTENGGFDSCYIACDSDAYDDLGDSDYMTTKTEWEECAADCEV